MSSTISRREFVETTAGLIVSFYLPGRAVAARAPADAPFAPNAWLRIGPDGIVTLTLDKSEMGQGSQTGRAACPPAAARRLTAPGTCCARRAPPRVKC